MQLPRVEIALSCCLSLAAAVTVAQDQRVPPELTLTEAIQIALMSNRPVSIAKLDISKSRWQLAATKTKRLPEIETYVFGAANLTTPSFTFKKGVLGTTDGTANGPPVPAKDINISMAQGFTGYVTATIAQPLSQLYKIGLLVREQELDLQLANEKYRAKRQSTSADVKQAYYAVLQTESALEAEQALVTQYQETDRLLGEYLRQESVLKSSSLDAKAKLAQALYQVTQMTDTLQTQKEQLNTILGRDLDTPFRTQQIPMISEEESDLKLARQTAVERRPEVKEAEIDTQRAEYDRRFAKAAYIPDVGLAFRYLNPINTQLLPQNIATVGAELKWTPFDWGKRRDDVRQKGDVVSQSRLQLGEVQAQVLLDVDKSFRKLSESRLLLQVAIAARDAANEKLRETMDQFRKSAVLLRDLLEQQAAVANANNGYEESLLAFWSAKTNFEKALGEE
jgi:outer membrane protein TolC